MRALAVLAKRHPSLRYVIIGDGPERVALEGLAARLEVAERVEFRGQLAPAEAIEQVRRCTLFAMPSTEEAFGVAYIEAMAGGVPAIGCRGEPGPEEIAAAGDGFMLVPPGDIERLTQRIDELLSDPQRLREAGIRARETVAANFSWERCGEQTVAAYEHALARFSACTWGNQPVMSRASATAIALLPAVDEVSRHAPIVAGAAIRTPMKPVLFVTGHAPAYRVGAFERLHERENVEFALFGGRLKHGGGSTVEELPFPHRHVRRARAVCAGGQRPLPRRRMLLPADVSRRLQPGLERDARACR